MRFTKSILALVVLLFSTMPALAFFPGGQKPASSKTASQGSRNAAPPANSQSSANSYQFQPKGPGPHRGDWLRKYGSLPPGVQEQQLKQEPAFRNLSPEKQSQLLDRLRNFNSQPPEKKQQILNRMETFEHLTPAQQETARNLFQRYHSLPDDQRTKISQAYRRLRGMPPDARNQLMNSPEFRNDYTEEQRDLLRGMTDLNLTPVR